MSSDRQVCDVDGIYDFGIMNMMSIFAEGRRPVLAQALDVAKTMIDIFTIKAQHGLDDGMTNLRLQKLMYIAQGYFLAKYGHPLYPEEIEAWKYGPVIPSLYSRYSMYKNGVIHDDPPVEGALTEEELELVLDVLSRYGRFSTGYLVDLSHMPGSPWSKAYDANFNNRIEKKTMEDYFKKQPPIPAFDKAIANLVIGKPEHERGKTGYILLPAEEYEDWDEILDV